MINIIHSQDFKADKSKKYFFDNNIWVYLFTHIASHKQFLQDRSSRILHQIKSSGASLYINSLVLSEFANSNIKYEYKLWQKTVKCGNDDYKKDFKTTPRYTEVQNEISASIKRIIKLTEYCDDVICNIDVSTLLSRMVTIDFNDSYYIELCKKENFILISNDKDFQSINDDINLVVL